MAEWPADRPNPPDRGSQPPVRPEAEVRDREIRRLQGLQMLMERVSGASIPDLASKYRVTQKVVGERLSQAWREGVLEALEGACFDELVPMAMAVYEAQLKLGSLDAARDILGSIGFIKKPQATLKVQPQLPPTSPTINSIDDYRLARQTRRYGGASPGARRMITPPGGTDVPQ